MKPKKQSFELEWFFCIYGAILGLIVGYHNAGIEGAVIGIIVGAGIGIGILSFAMREFQLALAIGLCIFGALLIYFFVSYFRGT